MKLEKDGKSIHIGKNASLQKLILKFFGSIDGIEICTKNLDDILEHNCYGACCALEKKGIITSRMDSKTTTWDPITN